MKYRILSILNHKLSTEQLEGLRVCKEIGKIYEICDNTNLKNLWANIPANLNNKNIAKYLQPLLKEIMKYHAVILAGELTACSIVIDKCREYDIDILIATSQRESIETILPNGSVKKTSRFNHVMFRSI